MHDVSDETQDVNLASCLLHSVNRSYDIEILWEPIIRFADKVVVAPASGRLGAPSVYEQPEGDQ